MEKKFTEQDSLQLINEMIAQAKNNFRKGAANSMIFCGYSVAIVACINVILLHVLDKPYYSYWIWVLMAPMTFITFFIDKRGAKKEMVKTHIDKIVGSVWKGFVVSVVLFITLVFGMVYVLQSWSPTLIFNPGFLILTGLAQYITASACRFKPYFYGAYVFWLGFILCMLSFVVFSPRTDIQFIILALSVIFGFCVPGHILNRKAEQHV